MATATVAESDGLVIEQAVAEYEALCAGGPDSFHWAIETVDGKVELCGSEADPAHVTICYVPHGADAVLPLAVGEAAGCFARFEAIDRSGRPFWDPRSHPPLAAIVDGARRPFRPMRGRFVVGAVEAPGRVVLLAAVGESLTVIHLAGKARTVVYSGRPLTFSEVDVDRTIRWRRSREVDPRPAPRVRPPAKVRAYHLRIAGAVEVDVGDGPSVDAVLSRGLRALEWRARTVKLPGRRRRGKTKLRLVLAVFFRLVRAGGGIFEGGPAELLAEIAARCPDFDLDVETFSNVLGLLLAAGTCLVQRPAPREWRLCLSSELLDPRSDLHRRFCEETVGLVRKLVEGEVLTGANEDAANGPSPATSPRGKRSVRAGGSPTTTSEPGTPADAANSGDGAPTPRSADSQPAPAYPATEPADALKQPASPAQDAKIDTGASSGDAATTRVSGQRLSPAEAKSPATSGSAPAAVTARPTELDLDFLCSNPKLAAESLFALMTKIGSRIADEPDPLARRSYELTFTSAMFTCFIRQGVASGTDAERRRQFSTTLIAGPATRHEAPSSRTKQPGAGSEEVATVHIDTITAAAGVDRHETGMNEETAERPAPELPSAAAVPAEAAGPVIDHDGTDAASAADRDEAAAFVCVETKLIVQAVETAGVGAGAVAGQEPAETAEAVDQREVGVIGRTAEQPDAAAVAHDEAKSIDGVAERMVVGADAGMVGRAAPELDDTAEHTEIGAGAGDEEFAELADEAHPVAVQGGVMVYEEPAIPVATTDRERSDVWSNTGVPAAVTARCGPPPDRQAQRRRSLFAPDNCIALLTLGWTAPLIKAPPVPLMRFAVPVPLREPRSITDVTCTVAITTAGPELAQGLQGPLQA